MKEGNFCNKHVCTQLKKKLKYWAEIDGFETYIGEDKMEVYSLSPDKCINAAHQFEIAHDKGGEYFSNIIKTPHFSNKEIEAILNIL